MGDHQGAQPWSTPENETTASNDNGDGDQRTRSFVFRPGLHKTSDPDFPGDTATSAVLGLEHTPSALIC